MSTHIAPSQGGYERWLDQAADDRPHDEPAWNHDTYCSCVWHANPDECPHEKDNES
jgi:hypothetical protein